jgi:ABC-type branched-subunit amino acid transport system ATPase component
LHEPATASHEPATASHKPAVAPVEWDAPLLTLRGFSAAHEGRTALAAVDLCIPRRGLHALVSSDGGSLSALLGILSGRHRAASGWKFAGDIEFDGQVLGLATRPAVLGPSISQSTQTLRGYLLQDLLPVTAQAVSQSAVQQQLVRAGLGHLAPSVDSPLGQVPLSAGEWWLLSIARELFSDPKLLCLDDPLASLSPPQVQALSLLLRRESTQRSLLIATPRESDALLCGAQVHWLPVEIERLPAKPETRPASVGADLRNAPHSLRAALTSDAQPAQTATRSAEPAQAPPPVLPSGASKDRKVIHPAAPAAPVAPAMSDPAPLLRLRDLTVHLQGRPLLPTLSLDIAARGLHVLIARNEAQRRLLLRVLCGPLSPQMTAQGTAIYEGRDLLTDRSSMPMSPPREARWLMLTAREYLLHGLHIPQIPSKGALLPSLVQFIELAGFPELLRHLDVALCDLHPHERRQIEVLRCASLAPRLLVLDDPLLAIPLPEQRRLLHLLNVEAERRAILVLAADPSAYDDLSSERRPWVAWFDDSGLGSAPIQPDSAAPARHGEGHAEGPALVTAPHDAVLAAEPSGGVRTRTGPLEPIVSAVDLQRRKTHAGS